MRFVSFCREFLKLSRECLFELRWLVVWEIFASEDEVVGT